ncbi:hypothetical protein INR49_004539 [Caranx melampygus]|nr:hypothetical protein INR49_004539 [Caranx melampygus]
MTEQELELEEEEEEEEEASQAGLSSQQKAHCYRKDREGRRGLAALDLNSDGQGGGTGSNH